MLRMNRVSLAPECPVAACPLMQSRRALLAVVVAWNRQAMSYLHSSHKRWADRTNRAPRSRPPPGSCAARCCTVTRRTGQRAPCSPPSAARGRRICATGRSRRRARRPPRPRRRRPGAPVRTGQRRFPSGPAAARAAPSARDDVRS